LFKNSKIENICYDLVLLILYLERLLIIKSKKILVFVSTWTIKIKNSYQNYPSHYELIYTKWKNIYMQRYLWLENKSMINILTYFLLQREYKFKNLKINIVKLFIKTEQSEKAFWK
jgi:hypothetical protein